jgi:hypothetical protein
LAQAEALAVAKDDEVKVAFVNRVFVVAETVAMVEFVLTVVNPLVVTKDDEVKVALVDTVGVMAVIAVLVEFALAEFVLAEFVLAEFVLAEFVLAEFVLAEVVLAESVLAEVVLAESVLTVVSPLAVAKDDEVKVVSVDAVGVMAELVVTAEFVLAVVNPAAVEELAGPVVELVDVGFPNGDASKAGVVDAMPSVQFLTMTAPCTPLFA